MIPNTTPVFAVDEKNLVPVSNHLKQMMDIPPSRMFIINKSLKVYVEKNPGAKIFDASQGDGGASLPGTQSRCSNARFNSNWNMGLLMTCRSEQKRIANP